MKIAYLTFTAVSFVQLSTAELNQRTVLQSHVQRRTFVPRRDRLTVTDSSISSSTVVPEIVVYIDQFGKPVSTATETVVVVPSAASTTKSLSILSSSTLVASPIASLALASTLTSAKFPVSKELRSAPVVRAQSSSGGSNLPGITYSPYKGTGACKSTSEVNADFSVFAANYGVVRLYGVDCNQVATAYAAAKKYGNKLFLGIFDINAVTSAVSTIASGVQNDWSIVNTISVGNELVNNGAKTAAQVVAAVKQARTALRSAGYHGPVVTVDTFVAAINHPELCDQSDYCAVNIHPFFDPNTDADQAGSFITNQLARIRSNISNSTKRIVVTETGWPWKGDTNGAAVPSLTNQAAAISSIQGSFSGNPADCFMFTAFNDLWKQADNSTFRAEQYWGMGGRYSASDQ